MPTPFLPADQKRFEAALARFNAANARDPNIEIVNGEAQPRELVYSQWLTAWVLKLCPGASEALRLAAHCQHLRRWEIPRHSYPMDRAGYLRWRADLKKFHAEKSGETLRELGYGEDMIRRVQELNLKKHFPQDDETRVLEDALCLVFLEHQFAALAAKTSENKMIAALQKSWAKMTPSAHESALQLSFGETERRLLNLALLPGRGPI